MKLGKELRVALVGLVVSLMTILIGFFVKPVQASGCNTGASCTFYANGQEYSGSCESVYQGNQHVCGCLSGGNLQNQTACGAPPAP